MYCNLSIQQILILWVDQHATQIHTQYPTSNVTILILRTMNTHSQYALCLPLAKSSECRISKEYNKHINKIEGDGNKGQLSSIIHLP